MARREIPAGVIDALVRIDDPLDRHRVGNELIGKRYAGQIEPLIVELRKVWGTT